MKKLIFVLAFGLLGTTLSADPYAFTYQAALRDDKGEIIKGEGGNPLLNHTVEMRLYNVATGGEPLWGRAYSVLTDENGLFNVSVTDTAGSKLDDVPADAKLEDVFRTVPAGSLFIGITVQNSSGEIVPRQCVFATPFAAVANDVRAVSGDLKVGGNITFGEGEQMVVISKDGIDQRGGSSVVQKLSVNGDVSIGGTLNAGGGVLSVSGDGVTVKGHPLNVEDTQLQINGSEVVPVPVGGIIMWTKAALPDNTHWAVCNGNNGTPDLRGRFIVGANNSTTGRNGSFSAYDPDVSGSARTGGEERHQLTVDEMPSHNHTYNFKGADLSGGWDSDNYFYNQSEKYGGNNNQRSTNATGGNGAHENRPPYYALYYIMRIR